MVERINQHNALYHANELFKVLMNAAILSALSGRMKIRWTVLEMGQVFDVAWGGRSNWRYGTIDIIRLMKTLQEMGFVSIQTGIFGRTKSYALSPTGLQFVEGGNESILAAQTRTSATEEVRRYSEYIDGVVARAKAADEDLLFGILAIGAYDGALEAAWLKTRQRAIMEKTAIDLITAGGKPSCVLTALANAGARHAPGGKAYTKSPIQVQKELDELGSVEAFINALAKFQSNSRV